MTEIAYFINYHALFSGLGSWRLNNMFIPFFYELRDAGVPVSPTAFLTLQKALSKGLVENLDDFYTASRAILVKSERWFDMFDRLFAHHFEGAELGDLEGVDLTEAMRALLDEWLKDPAELAQALGMTQEELSKYTPDELIKYFMDRLKDQDGRHEGGSRWIGTGGRSPVGHSGHHPGGMRVGGESRNKSAVKLALERRYKDYSQEGLLKEATIAEALKRLRHMIPVGPKDRVNVDETIYRTTKNGGEIEIIFERSLKDRLKIILAIDNGGWSMDPYIPVVQTLFDYARAQFKDIKTYFFHNTIYGTVWEDPARRKKPVRITDLARRDPDTRLILVGDASMAPYELLARDGSMYIDERSGIPSLEQLRFLAETFPHNVWLNPVPARMWHYTRTIALVQDVFPMFELTLDGLDQAVAKLMRKN